MAVVSEFSGRGAHSRAAAARTRDVQMTSRSMMFIKLSQLTRWPLYVSPLLSSMSCNPRYQQRERCATTRVSGGRFGTVGGTAHPGPSRYHGVALGRRQEVERQLVRDAAPGVAVPAWPLVPAACPCAQRARSAPWLRLVAWPRFGRRVPRPRRCFQPLALFQQPRRPNAAVVPYVAAGAGAGAGAAAGGRVSFGRDDDACGSSGGSSGSSSSSGQSTMPAYPRGHVSA